MSVKPVEDGMHTITPHLVCAGAAEAIAFYERAFGAQALMRLDEPGGKVAHASLRIGDSIIMLMDEAPQWHARGPKALQGTPVTIHLAVDDVDRWYQRALAAGATSHLAPADMFWGDRYGVVEDPFGHHWSIATHVRDVPLDELKQAMGQAMPEGGMQERPQAPPASP